jgi:hypothetical protein
MLPLADVTTLKYVCHSFAFCTECGSSQFSALIWNLTTTTQRYSFTGAAKSRFTHFTAEFQTHVSTLLTAPSSVSMNNGNRAVCQQAVPLSARCLPNTRVNYVGLVQLECSYEGRRDCRLSSRTCFIDSHTQITRQFCRITQLCSRAATKWHPLRVSHSSVGNSARLMTNSMKIQLSYCRGCCWAL